MRFALVFVQVAVQTLGNEGGAGNLTQVMQRELLSKSRARFSLLYEAYVECDLFGVADHSADDQDRTDVEPELADD
jgi:hypothetical protein